jgi:hypothetical protein
MPKADLRKQLKHLYAPSAKGPVIVDVPEMGFLMVDGKGDPEGGQEFQEAMGALYGVAYTLKFALKKADPPVEYSVMPPEGLWWLEDMRRFSFERREDWLWTLMIAQPPEVTGARVAQAVDELRRRKDPPGLGRLRFGRLHEGLSAQIMHIGPYAEEPPTVARLHAFIAEKGYRMRGKHHEIYLSDPRRAAPEKMRTVLRQPVE